MIGIIGDTRSLDYGSYEGLGVNTTPDFNRICDRMSRSWILGSGFRVWNPKPLNP